MTPQERDLITSLLARLQQRANQPKDPEADALIRQGVSAQPDAAYFLVQTVLIEDMALQNAQSRIAELERQLAEAKTAAQPQAPSSFLGGAGQASVPAAGPWHAAPPAPAPAQPGPVWRQSGGAPMPGAASMAPAVAAPMTGQPSLMPGAGSGFLRQAATTAVGVAGGSLLFQGIESLFAPHYGGGFLGGTPMQPGLSETVINNYYGDASAGQPDPGSAGDESAGFDADPGQGFAPDPGVTDADFSPDQDAGTDDGGGFDDGGTLDV